MNVNMDRLQKNLEELGRIGRDARGGITRPSFSRADLEARAWLKEKICTAGLAIAMTARATCSAGLKGGSGRTIMAGSHIDTVINGGMFDGSVGVLAALECLRADPRGGTTALASPSKSPRSRTRKETSSAISSAAGRSSATLDRDLLEKGTTVVRHAPRGRPQGHGIHDRLDPRRPPRGARHRGLSRAPHRTGPGARDRRRSHRHRRAASPASTTAGARSSARPAMRGPSRSNCARTRFSGWPISPSRRPGTSRRTTTAAWSRSARSTFMPGAFSIVPGRADFSFEFRSTSRETLKRSRRSCSPWPRTSPRRAAWRSSRRSWTRPTPVASRPG